MQADPLTQLRDVHLPTEPGWWPPAPGWWLLALALLIALCLLAQYARRYYLQRQPFRTALQLHQQLRQALNAKQISIEDYLHDANGLLKRVFIHARRDQHSAPLAGSAWLAHLDSYVEGQPFSRGLGQLLTETRFAPNVDANAALQLNQLQRHIDAVLANASRKVPSQARAND